MLLTNKIQDAFAAIQPALTEKLNGAVPVLKCPRHDANFTHTTYRVMVETEAVLDDDYEDDMTNGYQEVARFRLRPMSGCHALVLVNGLRVEPDYQRKGIATLLMKAIASAAKSADVALLIATTTTNDANTNEMLGSLGWGNLNNGSECGLHSFVNPATGNTVIPWRFYVQTDSVPTLQEFVSAQSQVPAIAAPAEEVTLA